MSNTYTCPKVDEFDCQTAIEFLRQHIDDGGMYHPRTKQWRYVKNVTYITTLNAAKRPDIPPLSGRLIQHFAMFAYLPPRFTNLYYIIMKAFNILKNCNIFNNLLFYSLKYFNIYVV